MNRLAQETSPYLLQHANNPVHWFAWGEEALQKAKSENKPILVSIGYSACHWCHVMERESFENEYVASVMNAHFICIKVDREERPDVDSVYMDAVQTMGVRGGWPLNVFLLPDAKPFYGVTYLPPQNWVKLLESIHHAFTNNYSDLESSAQGFVDTLNQTESQKYGFIKEPRNFNEDQIDTMFETLKNNFDLDLGGMNRAPKFPMPSIYKFLLRYFDQTQHPEALAHLELSLSRMALGGIYDHVEGGWARYSVDEHWFIPHFEKMLYDNAQLLSIFSEAYTLTKNPLFSDRIRQTISWLENEMQNPEGGFYSALDADTEGIEGRYYIYTATELQDILGEDYSWFAKLYQIHPEGNWEHGYNHLHLSSNLIATAKFKGIFSEDLEIKYQNALEKLRENRKTRIKPGIDDKILASWNGLLITGLCDAYRAIGDESIRMLASQTGFFIRNAMTVQAKLLHSYKNGKASIMAFLEDYGAVIEAYLALYQITFNESWLYEAQKLCDYAISNFYDPKDGFFFFTDLEGEVLIARKKEIFDNVIPSSNSIMATNLYKLGKILDREDYLRISNEMLSQMQSLLLRDVQWVTNWAALHCMRVTPTAEIAFVGKECDALRKDMDRFFIPNKVVMGTLEGSTLPLLDQKTEIAGQSAIYVCFDKTCQLPVTSVEDALKQLI
jgi:uncharacterized protein YyaL (SSP411 family)